MERDLVLADGTIFHGEAIGANVRTLGELVFNTGMSGYQETLTDQSYNGQIIVFTYPLIGNAGINRDDYETIQPTVKGVVVRETANVTGNWRAEMTLSEYLQEVGVPGITGVDTRALTKKLRTVGTMKAMLVDHATEESVNEIKHTVLPTNQVLTSATKTPFPVPGTGRKVVVVDFGFKQSILRELTKRQCNVIVVPPKTTASEIKHLDPDGVLLSNGPGNPKDVGYALPMIQAVQGKIPLFGICLGHQLFALANGADTFKMKFGHRGFNHPVREIATGRIDFTSQNHGYAVDPASINRDQLMITHEEINDHTVEGLRHREYPAFSVQFHPDANPGPHDADHLFDDFMDMMSTFKQQGKGVTAHA
ncbi:carbamoyl phosphate synthase small subunit [Schleiferilactobacillus perolens]|uniref:Carbamoyl phosphate synthase small chain n=1 Tax=Schleiferilactobacillus perolens DSM 12744 TaxID=1423792 RepID=A0A0R1MKG9_9LACO|nr:carbamoyl phosphate synthase small subunit [Schleiferilactobacillus perolens]KRL08431.1 carbamoyl phosphate synthase small subunit [Schleiferilactobacillus perolens DSM 12744]